MPTEPLLHIGAGGVLALLVLRTVFKFLDGRLVDLLEELSKERKPHEPKSD